MDHIRFAKNITGLKETLEPRTPPLSELVLEMYSKALSRFTDDQITEAIMKAAATLKWMPRPAELIELINGGKQSPEAQALLAWEQLYQAIGSHGHNASILFTDGRISRVVRLMGGWQEVCMWLEKDMKWHRKDFLEYYKSLPADTDPELLAGECARLAALGHRQGQPDPVVIGDTKLLAGRTTTLPDQVLRLVEKVSADLSTEDEEHP